MPHCCFKKGCELDVQYICFCLSSETYSCEFHLHEHLRLPNRTHAFNSISTELYEWSRDCILKYFAKEKWKKEKLKKIVLTSFKKNWKSHKNSVANSLRELDFELNEISCIIEKINQYSDKEEGSNLNELLLQSEIDTEIVNATIPNSSELNSSVRQFYRLAQLRNKRSEMLNRVNNDPETEQDFRRTCSLYQSHDNNSLLSQAYQEYINAYKKISSLYIIERHEMMINLYIYDTKNEIEEVKALKIPKRLQNKGIVTAQLPNGELFFTGISKDNCCISFIIDSNHRIQELPAARYSWEFTTAVYFNKNVYFFGSHNPSSCRFDLDSNRWKILAETIKIDIGWSCYCNSILFNGNILISWTNNCNLLFYSIDIDSFSKIPYEFKNTIDKILISADKRLFLVECFYNGSIYESEINNEYVWTQITKSKIQTHMPEQVFCSYNEGAIYISIFSSGFREYFKFDLDRKFLIEIAFYSKQLALKRSGNTLEAIENYDQTFKLNPEHAAAYINKGYPLHYVGQKLNEIEDFQWFFIHDPKNTLFYELLGNNMRDLDRNHEAIEYYNKSIKFKPEAPKIYLQKGIILHDLSQNLEAIKCYNKAINLNPKYEEPYFNKGIALHDLGQNHEAIECFSEAIKLSNGRDFGSLCYRAKLLNDLGQELDALQDTKKAYNAFYKSIYCKQERWINEEYLELLEILLRLQKMIVKYKERLLKIKDANLSNPEMIKEFEENDKIIKEGNSHLFERALEFHVYNDLKSFKPVEGIQQIKKEAAEHQKTISASISRFLKRKNISK